MARDGDWLPVALVFAQPLALTTEPQPGRCQDCSSQTTEPSFLLSTGKNAGSAGPGQALPVRALAHGLQEQAERLAAWTMAQEEEAGGGRAGSSQPGQPGKMRLFVHVRPVGGAWPLMCPLQRPQFPELCSPHVMNLRAGKPWETSSHCWVCRGNQAQGGEGKGGEWGP